MNLIFDKKQIAAIYRVADMMVKADGRIFPEELATIEDSMKKLGVTSPVEFQEIKQNSSLMDDASVYVILSRLEMEQKRFVTSMLGTIISSDGDIDDNELQLWRCVTDECQFPYMSNRQAIEIYNNY